MGDYGTILKTTNGGENWGAQISGCSNNLYSVYFTDNQTGWAVGGYGTILKTTNGGGVTAVDEDKNTSLPNSYLLSQNYPNPFNPSTKIKYEIPKSSECCQIKVFDILGNEIKTLANEEKQHWHL